MRFVVVGTGRCGTTWLSDVFTAAGIQTGHEHMFKPDGYKDRWWYQDKEGDSQYFHGDVSLYALPVLERGLGHFDGVVVHLVRNPLDCIGSLAGWNLPSYPNQQGAGGQCVNDNLQFTLSPNNQVRNSTKYWVEWNYRCAALADFTVTVESLTVPALVELAAKLGHTVSEGAMAAGRGAYDTYDYSAFPVRPDLYRQLLNWDDIPYPEEVKALAERWY